MNNLIKKIFSPRNLGTVIVLLLVTGATALAAIPAYKSWLQEGTNLFTTGTNVGIGITTPAEKLQVAGTIHSISGGIKFPDNTVQTTASGAGVWGTSGANIYNTNTGNVGIGTAAPSAKLEVSGAGGLGSSIRTVNTAASQQGFLELQRTAGALNDWVIGYDLPSLGSARDFFIHDGVAGFTRLLIDANGNLGIGDTNPASLLTVGQGDKFQVSSIGALSFTDDLAPITFPPAAGVNAPMINMFSSGTGNENRMVLAHSPAFQNWGLQYQDIGDEFHFLSAGTPVMTIDLGASRVGIGTANPSAKLEVAGNTKITGNLDVTGTALKCVTFEDFGGVTPQTACGTGRVCVSAFAVVTGGGLACDVVTPNAFSARCCRL